MKRPGRRHGRWPMAALWLCATMACAQPAGPPGAGPAADEAVHVHTTQRGDTLIGLGRRLLAEPARWPELARANALRNADRIPTGTALRIPLHLMRTEAVPVTLEHVQGQASAAGNALRSGQTLPEGSEVSTGDDGHVTLRLVDGTLLRLRPASRVQLHQSRRVPAAGAVRSGTTLERGRIEIEAAPAEAGRPGFRIDTPQGVLAVRGTEFRVATDTTTRGEVLGGAVAFEGRGGTAPQRVAAGYGSVIGPGGEVAPPVRLLDAPDLAALPALQERLLMRFVLPPQAGAAAWRGQIAADSRFDRVLADLGSTTPELRFADLPDGDYVLRVRAIDAHGLEGRDADHRFRLKARPEPPLPSAPAPRAVISGGRVDFAWAAASEAASYRLRLARQEGRLAAATADFSSPLHDLHGLKAQSTTLEGLAPGVYHWQLASRRADGDQGPWGGARSFEIRPLPPTPQPPAVGDRTVRFGWDGAPGQTFDFELARDASFGRPLLQQRLTEPAVELPQPGVGRFYVRLRARDPDGYVGPYTTPQHFDIPNCLRDGRGGCVRAGGQPLTAAP